MGEGKYYFEDGHKFYCDVVGCGDNTYHTIRSYGDDGIIGEEHFINGKSVYLFEAHEDYCARIFGVCDPEEDNQAANKRYVDETISDALKAIGFAEEVAY